MTAARASLPGSPTTATAPAPERSPARGPVPRTLTSADAAASRTLARCPGCGGRCGGTCGASTTELDEDLLAAGQRALRRAVLARHLRAISPRS